MVGGAINRKDKELGEKLAYLQNTVGAVIGPMDSFLVLRGISRLYPSHGSSRAKC
ncbi:MAG: PLP-dependent transferase [Anaerolineales bacterium]|nr:PLP-dependent transferase [Anaerolineales bacterium]